MKEGVFRFKKFSVSHIASSMKVGVDGVLIGAWGNVNGLSGLDIGCGCGLIALMAAQRNENSLITAIDIDQDSVDEALSNFRLSPWSKRLFVKKCSAEVFTKSPDNREKFDFILSNPPFFNAGKNILTSAREKARHDGELSPQSLIDLSSILLKKGGRLSFIMPAQRIDDLKIPSNLFLEKVCLIADKPDKTPKRVMMTLIKSLSKIKATFPVEKETLHIRNQNSEYSAQYKTLTQDFYLDF